MGLEFFVLFFRARRGEGGGLSFLGGAGACVQAAAGSRACEFSGRAACLVRDVGADDAGARHAARLRLRVQVGHRLRRGAQFLSEGAALDFEGRGEGEGFVSFPVLVVLLWQPCSRGESLSRRRVAAPKREARRPERTCVPGI